MIENDPYAFLNKAGTKPEQLGARGKQALKGYDDTIEEFKRNKRNPVLKQMVEQVGTATIAVLQKEIDRLNSKASKVDNASQSESSRKTKSTGGDTTKSAGNQAKPEPTPGKKESQKQQQAEPGADEEQEIQALLEKVEAQKVKIDDCLRIAEAHNKRKRAAERAQRKKPPTKPRLERMRGALKRFILLAPPEVLSNEKKSAQTLKAARDFFIQMCRLWGLDSMKSYKQQKDNLDSELEKVGRKAA